MTSEDMSLTVEQQHVLQAIYDHFHEDGTWPSFITIDRPLRRTHQLNTQAVLRSLSDDLIVKPHAGLPFGSDDELRLRLRGIHARGGSTEDTDRFVRLLRWLAQKETDFEPEPGSTDTTPRVTSEEVSAYLGMPTDDHVALQRLYAMLQLDHWGLAGSGSNADGWQVFLGPEIWRFRDVQTIEDCINARLQWRQEAEAANPRRHNSKPPEAERPSEERLSTAELIHIMDGFPADSRNPGALPRPGDSPSAESPTTPPPLAGGPAPDAATNNQVSGTTQGHVVQAGTVYGGVHYYVTVQTLSASSTSAESEAALDCEDGLSSQQDVEIRRLCDDLLGVTPRIREAAARRLGELARQGVIRTEDKTKITRIVMKHSLKDASGDVRRASDLLLSILREDN